MKEFVTLLFSYLLGSIPVGLIAGKLLKGIDVREHGSGNIGATNVLRILGPGPASVVFALDIVKGLIPVFIAKSFFPDSGWLPVAAGMIAILGHSLSVFLRFRGGKGVATSLGVIIGLDPRVAGIGFGIWFVIVFATRYVSLASILAAASIPILMRVFDTPVSYQIFSLAAAVFVIAKHRSNMIRLTQGREPKWGEKANMTEVDRDEK